MAVAQTVADEAVVKYLLYMYLSARLGMILLGIKSKKKSRVLLESLSSDSCQHRYL